MEKKTFNIVIASPGDIVVERKIVREVCLGLNDSPVFRERGVSVRVEVWEDSFNSPESPQEKINRLIDGYDIFICIFYKRFSAENGEIGPGSLEEFVSAYDAWKDLSKPHFMFYFKELKISSMDELRDPQVNEVLKLKEKIDLDGRIYCAGYSAPYEFCENIYNHLEQWITEHV